MAQAVPRSEKSIPPLIPVRLASLRKSRAPWFLAADEAGAITGSTLGINGGNIWCDCRSPFHLSDAERAPDKFNESSRRGPQPHPRLFTTEQQEDVDGVVCARQTTMPRHDEQECSDLCFQIR